MATLCLENTLNQGPSELWQVIIEALQKKGHATTELGPTAGFAAMVAAARDAYGYLVPQTDHRRVGSIDGF